MKRKTTRSTANETYSYHGIISSAVDVFPSALIPVVFTTLVAATVVVHLKTNKQTNKQTYF